MPNQITRDIYVTKDALKNPIHYVRGTDLIPIVMRFCDFAIPSGATARIFVGKPDGNAVYTSATIEGNTVTIDVTEQMFVTLGLALMQVSIVDGDEELVTFAQPVMVEPNLKAGDFPESSTDITFLDDAIEQANEAVETATTAAQKAATAVQNANTAISKANSAIADVNEAVASMNANFANLAQVTTINALQTTAKTVVGAINELNSKFKNMYFYRPNTNHVISGLKISFEYTGRNNMLLWGQRNGDVMPFGLLIGISSSVSQPFQYANLTTNEVNPNWNSDDSSVNFPMNAYTDMIIISCAPLIFTQY